MKYKLAGQIKVSCWTEIEAESKVDALKIANVREVGSLCVGSIYPDIDECWHFENDGSPKKIVFDE